MMTRVLLEGRYKPGTEEQLLKAFKVRQNNNYLGLSNGTKPSLTCQTHPQRKSTLCTKLCAPIGLKISKT